MKQSVEFYCYPTTDSSGKYTIFMFYLDGLWDEDKLTLVEAIAKYPPDNYEWFKLGDDE